MRNFLYVLVMTMVLTGAYLFFFDSLIFVSWIHYISGFSLLAVFLIYGSDHTANYRRYIKYINYPMFSGILLWITALPALLSGLVVFFYETENSDFLIRTHLVLSVIFCIIFTAHLFKKKKWRL